MSNDGLKTALIVLSSAALALVILTYFVLFSPVGSYQPVVIKNSSSTTIGTFPTSTVSLNPSSTTPPTGTTTAITSGNTTGPSSEYAYPYPVSWNEAHEAFAITGASLINNQLTLTLAIQMGNVSECVPVNVRLVTDETGDLQAPDSPQISFTFPDTQTCNGTPGATYSQSLIFTVTPSTPPPFLFTTGGSANIFFNLAPNAAGGMDISLPSTSG